MALATSATTSDQWQRTAATTIHEFVREEEPAVLRRRILFAMMKKKGRIRYNASGDAIQWPVRYRRAKITVNSGNQPYTFQGEVRHQPAILGWAGYGVTDAMAKKEYLMNRGTAAIIKVFSQMIPLLMEDLEDQFCEEIYIDSAAAGNTGRMSGIETLLENNGTINITTGNQRTANAADVVASPNATYAGLVTNLANYGGQWGYGTAQTNLASTWPSGRGDAEYDFWSPVMVNYTSTAWGASPNTWATYAKTATRFAIRKLKRNARSGVQLVLLEDELYRQYLELLDSKERINVENTELRQLGFKDSFMQDGAEITSEYGMPAAVGYVFNVDDMELISLQGGIFEPLGPEFDMASNSYRVVVDCIGQFKFKSPRSFGCLKTYA